MPIPRARRRTAAALSLGVVCALVLTGQPALGGTMIPPVDSGNVGVHTLIDTTEYPGATCVYGAASGELAKLRIRRPIVFAFDRTSGPDSQTVGWRFKIEYTDDSVVWTAMFTSSIVRAKASDQHDAQWLPRSFTLPSPPTHPYYRVHVQMFWYHAGQVDGRANHWPYIYRHIQGADTFLDTNACTKLY